MLRDKRHCSQVLWFEAGSTTAKQAQLSDYPNCCTDTQYQPEKKHIGGIYLIDRFHFA